MIHLAVYADHLGSVEAVSDGNGANVVQYSYDAWGKARPTSGTCAYVSPAWGSCSATLPGKTTGYTGHENLTDVCLVDMEGRVYDPDLGRFMSADPMQGGDRYIYVTDNPLSLSDPSGYFANGEAGVGQAISDIGPLLSTIQPFCGVWCTAAAEAVGGYMQGGNDLTGGLEAGAISLMSSESMQALGSYYGPNAQGAYVGGMTATEAFMAKTVVEGLVQGALSQAGGGRFGSGFLGGVTGSGVGDFLNSPQFNSLSDPTKIIIAAVAGGTASYAAGGNFGNGAISAAFVEAFNDLKHPNWLDQSKAQCQSGGEKCTLIYGLGGKPYGYVPQSEAAQAWFSAQTGGNLSDWSCDSACVKQAAFVSLTGVSLLTGGSALAVGGVADLADSAETAATLRDLAVTLRFTALGSGAAALRLRPNIEGAAMLGANAATMLIPLPEVAFPVEAILLEIEAYHAAAPP